MLLLRRLSQSKIRPIERSTVATTFTTLSSASLTISFIRTKLTSIQYRKVKAECLESKGRGISQRISRKGRRLKVSGFISQLGLVGGAKQINWSSIMTKKTRRSALHIPKSLVDGQPLKLRRNIKQESLNGKLANLMRLKSRSKVIQ